MPFNAMLFNAMLFNAMLFNAMLFNAMLFNAMLFLDTVSTTRDSGWVRSRATIQAAAIVLTGQQ
jgi:hypothetical protein